MLQFKNKNLNHGIEKGLKPVNSEKNVNYFKIQN